jgi:hypothetical protein
MTDKKPLDTSKDAIAKRVAGRKAARERYAAKKERDERARLKTAKKQAEVDGDAELLSRLERVERLGRKLERMQKMIEEDARAVMSDARRTLIKAGGLLSEIDTRDQQLRISQTRWTEREVLGLRVLEWTVCKNDFGYALQVWIGQGWRDVPVVRVPPREPVTRTSWKDAREDAA